MEVSNYMGKLCWFGKKSCCFHFSLFIFDYVFYWSQLLCEQSSPCLTKLLILFGYRLRIRSCRFLEWHILQLRWWPSHGHSCTTWRARIPKDWSTRSKHIWSTLWVIPTLSNINKFGYDRHAFIPFGGCHQLEESFLAVGFSKQGAYAELGCAQLLSRDRVQEISVVLYLLHKWAETQGLQDVA